MFECDHEKSRGESCRVLEWCYPRVTASASPRNAPIFWGSGIAHVH